MELSQLAKKRLKSMLAAGEEIVECYRVLAKTKANVVGQILEEQDTFVEWNHYPDGDVFDQATQSQYYYHAHRGAEIEHGHFHVFLRQPGMPPGIKPAANTGTEEWPSGKDAICHLIAISMDRYGFPIRLFTTNRWVTGEAWYAGEDVQRMLDHYLIDHTWPSWATNRWISAMVALFHPQIMQLIEMRDQAVNDWKGAHPDLDVLEDRELDITSILEVSVESQILAVRKALESREA